MSEDRHRQDLYRHLERGLGHEGALLLMDELPRIDWEQLAADVAGMRTDLASVRTDLSQEIRSVRTDLSQEIRSVRTDLSQEIASVRTDLSQEIASVRTDQTHETALVRREVSALDERMDARFDIFESRLRTEIHQVRAELHRDARVQIFATLGGVAALLTMFSAAGQLW